MTQDSRLLKFLVGFGLALFYLVALSGPVSTTTLAVLLSAKWAIALMLGGASLSLYRRGPDVRNMSEGLTIAALALGFAGCVSFARLLSREVALGHVVLLVVVIAVAAVISVAVTKIWWTVSWPDLSRNSTAPVRHASKVPVISAVRVRSDEGSSCGVIISSDGLILAAGNAFEDCRSASVTLLNGELYPAEVVAVQSAYDLAILRIRPDHPLPAAKIADETRLEQDQLLAFMGYETDAVRESATWGERGHRHDIPVNEPTLVPALLSSVSDVDEEFEGAAASLIIAATSTVRPGYSGAAIVELSTGEVIGIHSGQIGAPGLMRAASSEMITTFLRDQNISPNRSWLWRMPVPMSEVALRRTWDDAAYSTLSRHRDRITWAWDSAKTEAWASWREHLDGYVHWTPDNPATRVIRGSLALVDGDAAGGLELLTEGLAAGLTGSVVDILQAWIENGGDRTQVTSVIERAFLEESGLSRGARVRALTLCEFLLKSFGQMGQHERILEYAKRVAPMAKFDGSELKFARYEALAMLRMGLVKESVERYREAASIARREEAYLDWTDRLEAEVAYVKLLEGEERVAATRSAARLAYWHSVHQMPNERTMALAAEAAELAGLPHLKAFFGEIGTLEIESF